MIGIPEAFATIMLVIVLLTATRIVRHLNEAQAARNNNKKDESERK